MASDARKRALQKLERGIRQLVESLDPEELQSLQATEEVVTPLLRIACKDVSFAITSLRKGGAVERLTKRQCQIARLIYEGLGNRAIAERLSLQEATVHAHLRRAYRELQLTRICLASLVPFLPEDR